MPDKLSAAIGWSDSAEGGLAGKEAAGHALKRLAFVKPKLALVFASSWLNQSAIVHGVRSVIGTTPLAGASTAGEIVPRGPVTQSCVVLLIASEGLICRVGCGEGADRAPREAGQQAAYAAMRDFGGGPRAGFLLFGDGLVSGYTDVVRGAQEVLGTSSLLVGCRAGDDLRFIETYQYCQNRVVSRAAVGALLGGSITIGVGMEHGFAPISTPRRITKAHANMIDELDGQPAVSVYEEYLGPDLARRIGQELTPQGLAYPLGIQPEPDQQWLLRNVIAFGEHGSLACNEEVSEEGSVQLMIGNRELALEASRKAALEAIRPLNQIACVLVFNSAMRRRILGSQYAALEIERIRETVGVSVPLAGCYTYGEQGPIGVVGHERVAVQTASVLIVALGT